MRYFYFFLGFLFAGMFGFLSPASAQSSTLYFAPASTTVIPGQTFRVTVMVDTKGEFVNAVAAYFMYPADKLEALTVDRTGSAMTLFAEDKASGGRVDISGGTPTPGFSGVQKIASVDFRVKPAVTGTATLSFLSDAAVLRDSDNQNILDLPNSGKATFQISQIAPKPVPPPPPPPAGGPTPPSTPTPIVPPPPVSSQFTISDITVEKGSGETVILSWTTNEETMGSVSYGLSAQGDFPFSVSDGAFTKEHSFVLLDVTSPEEYSLEITGVDKLGNQVKAEHLTLKEFLVQENNTNPPEVVDPVPETGRFKMSLPLLIGLGLFLIFAVLLVVFLVFSRGRP